MPFHRSFTQNNFRWSSGTFTRHNMKLTVSADRQRERLAINKKWLNTGYGPITQIRNSFAKCQQGWWSRRSVNVTQCATVRYWSMCISVISAPLLLLLSLEKSVATGEGHLSSFLLCSKTITALK